MWSGLERVSEQVTRYGTVCGQLWYLIVFVFRMIVVVTIGANVYNDEQSAFRCSTKIVGCDNVCYDRFSKISHIRYWAFQLLAVSAPTVLFHFFSVRVRGQIEKYNALRKRHEELGSTSTIASAAEDRRLLKRRKSIGPIKTKQVYSTDNELVDITLTRRIQIAYYVTVILRAVTEFVSLVLTYKLFHFTDHTVEPNYNPFDIILIRIPQVYRCDGENVKWACGQHLNLGKSSGYVPCWVSRPWEKTIFMCYMNALSAICLILSVVEMLQLSGRVCYHWGKRRYTKLQRQKSQRITFQDQVKQPTNMNGTKPVGSYGFMPSDSKQERVITSIAVPVSLTKDGKGILRHDNEEYAQQYRNPKPPEYPGRKKKKKKIIHPKKPLGIRMLTSDPEDSEEYSSDDESESDSSELGSVEPASDGNASY